MRTCQPGEETPECELTVIPLTVQLQVPTATTYAGSAATPVIADAGDVLTVSVQRLNVTGSLQSNATIVGTLEDAD